MNQNSVPESEWGVWFDCVRIAEGRRCAHPTVVSHVELDGVVKVCWVVHERDALVGGGSDGAGVVHPSCRFAEALLFVYAAFGVSDAATAIADADGFCHSDAEESEGGCTEGDGLFGGDEFGINVDAPEVGGGDAFLTWLAGRFRGSERGETNPAVFGEDGVPCLVFPERFEFSRAVIVRIFEPGDVDCFDGAPVVGPK